MNNRITVSFETTREFIDDVYKAVPFKKELTKRPWNRHQPEDTFWWLIPSTDWPAYKHGKVIVSKEKIEGENFFVGIVIEKGPGAIVGESPLANSKTGVLDESWCWNYFMEDIKSGTFEKALNKLSQNIKLPIYLRVGAHVINEPSSFDPYECGSFNDAVMLNYYESGVEITSKAKTFLFPLNKVSNLSDIYYLLSEIKEINWIWIDFFIGIYCKKVSKNETSWDSNVA